MRFVDFLVEGGFRVWQMLPLGPTHEDRSPYQTTSIHAGNPDLISIELLRDQTWARDADWPISQSIDESIGIACELFFSHAGDAAHEEFEQFTEDQSFWLSDYALYRAIKKEQGGAAWMDWSPGLRDRAPGSLEAVTEKHRDEIRRVKFEQFVFFTQWLSLKDYANRRGVELFGDMPIFVAHDSADVWARRDLFELDEGGGATVVSGVPPDYFSETGQRWGNPHYRWERMQVEGFSWWVDRLRTQMAMFDLVRVDHFRGFEAVWEIPTEYETGEHGRWVPVPGLELFDVLLAAYPELPLVAEDLGVITESVEALRDRFGFPGMKILQFAFGGNADNPYLPHNHIRNAVVYTGTHDNNTTCGWFDGLDEQTRRQMLDYLGADAESMPWPLIRAALSSVCALAVIPMQDLLELGAEHRMNVPGVTEGNWRWRFEWAQVEPRVVGKIAALNRLFGRTN